MLLFVIGHQISGFRCQASGVGKKTLKWKVKCGRFKTLTKFK